MLARRQRGTFATASQPSHGSAMTTMTDAQPHLGPPPANLKELRSQQKRQLNSASGSLPMDNLLRGMHAETQSGPLRTLDVNNESRPISLGWQNALRTTHNQQSLQELYNARDNQQSQMFLKPGSLPKGEKVLQIVDFIDNIVPKEEETTLSDNGFSKLVITYGKKKIKLENVTLNQWVVRNTRIFNTLLFSNKLPTLADISDYLAYTVKIMELANKYEWTSALKYVHVQQERKWGGMWESPPSSSPYPTT